MTSTPDSTNTKDFRFGLWTAHPSLQRLTGEAGEVLVEPRVMRVLVCLAQAQGQPVSREALLQDVWGNVLVTEDSVTLAVSELRKVLGDDPRRPRYIETIRKVGYRFLPSVQWLESSGNLPAPERDGQPAATSDHPHSSAALPAPAEGRLGALPPAPLQRRLQLLFLALVLLTVVGVLGWKLIGAADRSSPKTVPGGAEPARAALTRTEPSEAAPESSRLFGPGTTLLTTYPGLELGPALSPDGRQLAFVKLEALGGQYRIFLKNLDTETPVELGGDMTYQGVPQWSPDGSSLAFIGCDAGGCAIFLQALPGQDPRRLLDLRGPIPESLSWAPDGSFLAFADRRGSDDASRIYRLALSDLDVVPLTPSNERSVEDFYPSLSPDGRYLAFARGLWRVDTTRGLPGLVGRIFLLELATGRLQQLTEEPRDLLGLDWRGESRSLVFAALDKSAGATLSELSIDGGGEREFFHSGFLIRHPQVHRPTGRILFEHWNGDQNIWHFALDDQGQEQTLSAADGQRYLDSTRFEAGARFSPDGSRIAFLYSRTGSPEVWIRDTASESLHQLTDFPTRSLQPPYWSPDGRRLAFVVQAQDGSHLYLADARALTVDHQPLAFWPGNLRLSSWSRDGRSLYGASDRSGSWQLWKIDAATGQSEQLTTSGGTTAAEAPGKGRASTDLYLYFTRPKQPGLWRRPLDQFPEAPEGAESVETAPAELFAEDLNPFDEHNWGLTNAGIFYCYRTGRGSWLRVRDFETGALQTLAQLPWTPPPSHSLDLSPDGRDLLLSQVENLSTDVLALEPPS